MTEPVQSLSAAFTRDIQHLNTVSHNVANINTPGYQAKVSFDQYQQQIDQTLLQETISAAPGALRQTKRALDIAITGQGYFLFEVNGQQLLSRDGRLHLDPQGYLANTTGARIVTDKGPLQTDAADVRIQANGDVLVNGKVVATLKLVNATSLQPAVGGLMLGQGLTDVAAVQLQSSALNTSTVNATTETVRMMEISRHLQSVQKAAAAYDQMLQNGINEIGKR
jgi:flagellar basal body rod protein FlgG